MRKLKHPVTDGRFFLVREKGGVAGRMIALLLFFLISFPFEAHALGVGDKSPDFTITTLKGREIAYNRDLKGKRPVYLIFWATW